MREILATLVDFTQRKLRIRTYANLLQDNKFLIAKRNSRSNRISILLTLDIANNWHIEILDYASRIRIVGFLSC